jgi:hypothetical protein
MIYFLGSFRLILLLRGEMRNLACVPRVRHVSVPMGGCHLSNP